MSAPHEPFLGPEGRLDSFWLPPGTIGNGRTVSGWAQIAVVDRDHGPRLLATFAAVGIPACWPLTITLPVSTPASPLRAPKTPGYG